MVTFRVHDMACGHCASTITRAIACIDKAARLNIRIEQKLVHITSTASTAELAEAIHGAGYTPRQIRDEPVRPARVPARTGCGCGCGSQKAASVEVRRGAAPAGAGCCG